MSFENVMAKFHCFLCIERSFQTGQPQSDGRVAIPGVAQEFCIFAVLAADKPLSERWMEEHVRVIRSLNQEALQQFDSLHKFLPGERFRTEESIHRMVNF